jgi:glycerophosphoryl diester phosphodiesterase
VEQSRDIAIIGHRGAPGYRPEHTSPSYRLAFERGADAVEPDIVATKDGVLVVRHENEISGTTDVAARSEFRDRRTTKQIEGGRVTGWFTEDFTWAELSGLRATERLPQLRRESAKFNGTSPILRLRDVLAIVDEVGAERASNGQPAGLVAEIKHASYFSSIGLPLDELFAAEISDAGWNTGDGRLTVESFEKSVLNQIRSRGVRSRNVFLLERTGAPADEVARHGSAAARYESFLTGAALAELAREVEGISVDKAMILRKDSGGRAVDVTDLVPRAHRAGLAVFTWTLRPENRFLAKNFRVGTDLAAWGEWQREFELILGSGVDGVFADHPDLAVAAVARLRESRVTAERADATPN